MWSSEVYNSGPFSLRDLAIAGGSTNCVCIWFERWPSEVNNSGTAIQQTTFKEKNIQ